MKIRGMSASYNERGIRQQYHIILIKLQSTIAKNKAAFPQLSAIEEFLDVDFPDTNNDKDYISRLEELCSYLNELSTSSYVIRHLHHNLCADVEAVKNNTFLFNQEESYLILP